MKLALRVAALIAVAVAAWLAIESFSERAGVEATAPRESEPKNETAAVELPLLGTEARPNARDVEPARAEVEIPRVEIAQPAGEPKATATLLVHVVSRETRAPLAGKRIQLKANSSEGWHAVFRDPSGRSHAIALTADDGRAPFEVDAGEELEVYVQEAGSKGPVRVPSLAARERREVEVELPSEPDMTLIGRLVDADTGVPVSNGVVWLDPSNDGWLSLGPRTSKIEKHDAAAEIHARSDGTFELQACSWRDRFADAKADGYTRVVFSFSRGHAVGEPPVEVRLSRAATLDVVVLENGRASAKASVALTTDSYQIVQSEPGRFDFAWVDDPRWEAETDANGFASVTDLPSRVPLELTIHARGTLARKEAQPVTLERGERRQIEIHVGSGGSIAGRIEDSQGEPVKYCEIWRVAGQPGYAQMLQASEQVAATSRSDDEGRFRFDDVAQGTWLVGPAPAREINVPDRAAIAALAQPVEMVEGAGEVELVLHVERGLYITGTVLDPSGTGVKGTYARAQQVNGFVSAMARTDDAGQFTLGPLVAGEYEIEAGVMHGQYSRSEPIRAAAGAGDLVLRLGVGGSILGRVVDASGAAQACELMLSQSSVEVYWSQTATRDGSIKFDGLLAGTYTLHAISSDGRTGTRAGIVVHEGETVDGIEVALVPGARLDLRYTGERRFAEYEVLSAGERCRVNSVESGSQESTVVPTGELEVRWRTHPESSTHSERFTLGASERRAVMWDGKP